METGPGAVRILPRGEQSRINRGHQIRPNARGVRGHQPVSIVHGRFNNPVILDGSIQIRIVERLHGIGMRDLFIHRNAVFPRRLERQRRLILVVTRIAGLRGMPAFLAGLEQRDGARGGVANSIRRRGVARPCQGHRTQ